MHGEDAGRHAGEATARRRSDFLPLKSLARDLTLAGVLVYGVLFYAYARYFDELDARPEDVGITYLYVLARSVGPVVLFLILIGLWAAIMYLVLRLWIEIRCGLIRQIIAAVVFGAAVVLVVLIILMVHGGPRRPYLAISALLFSVPICEFAYFKPIWPFTKKSWPAKPEFVVALRGVIWLGLASIGVFVLFLLGVRANDMADSARHGSPVKPWRVVTLTMLDVQATPARVAWVGPTDEIPQIGILPKVFRDNSDAYQVRYLGASSGQALLLILNDKKAQTVRIPIANIVVDTCRGGTDSTEQVCGIR
jgi:hypothetical protein